MSTSSLQQMAVCVLSGLLLVACGGDEPCEPMHLELAPGEYVRVHREVLSKSAALGFPHGAEARSIVVSSDLQGVTIRYVRDGKEVVEEYTTRRSVNGPNDPFAPHPRFDNE